MFDAGHVSCAVEDGDVFGVWVIGELGFEVFDDDVVAPEEDDFFDGFELGEQVGGFDECEHVHHGELHHGRHGWGSFDKLEYETDELGLERVAFDELEDHGVVFAHLGELGLEFVDIDVGVDPAFACHVHRVELELDMEGVGELGLDALGCGFL